MRKLRLCVIQLALVVAHSVSGQITFSFNYNDAGVGFNDPGTGATRRGALESAAAALTSYFSGYPSRTITFDVVSFSDSMDGSLASAGSPFFVVNNSFEKTLAQTLLQTGDTNSQTVFGSINWNFGHDWDYDDSINAGLFDFKSVAMHEVLHALGFASYISSTGTGAGSGTTWSFFDQFLTNSAGGRLVDTGGNYVGGTILSDGTGSDVYFSGPNAMAANGGNRVRIYSPATYLSGSSLSHLDTDIYGSNTYIMTHAVATGPSVRTLSAIELGILQDLGYSVTAIPEPSTYAALAGVLALAIAMYRRRLA